MKMSISKDNRAALERAAKYFGCGNKLAKEIGVHSSNYYFWRAGKYWMSYKTACKIEIATKGKVKTFELMPNYE